MSYICISPDLEFVDPIGRIRTTDAGMVLLDDGCRDQLSGDYELAARPHHKAPRGRMDSHYAMFNHHTMIVPWLASKGGHEAQVGAALSQPGQESLAHIVMMHEVGHAIAHIDMDDVWVRRMEETWCDAFACAAALARGFHPDGVRATATLHGTPSLPQATDQLDTTQLRNYWEHDTRDIPLAVLARWNAAPWTDVLSAFLRVASEECAALRTDPESERAAWQAFHDAAETRGRRCCRRLGTRFVKIDGALAEARAIDAVELAHEVLSYLQAGMTIVHPRLDLRGGRLAASALAIASERHSIHSL